MLRREGVAERAIDDEGDAAPIILGAEGGDDGGHGEAPPAGPKSKEKGRPRTSR